MDVTTYIVAFTLETLHKTGLQGASLQTFAMSAPVCKVIQQAYGRTYLETVCNFINPVTSNIC